MASRVRRPPSRRVPSVVLTVVGLAALSLAAALLVPPAHATPALRAAAPLSAVATERVGDPPPTQAPSPALTVGPVRNYHFGSVHLNAGYGAPTWLAYDSGVSAYYVAQNNSTVQVVPVPSFGTGPTIPVGSLPFGVTYDPTDGRVFVADSGSANLSVISDATNRTIASVSVGLQPFGVAFDPTSDRVYVADGGSDSVTVVDARTLQVVATIAVGAEPVGVAFDTASDEVFVANEGSANVSVISAASDALAATTAVPAGPYAVAVDNATGDVYISESQSGTVSVLNGTGTGTIATVSVGGTPQGITYDWRNQTVWVADGSTWVVVLNASSQQVVQDLLFDPLGAAYDGVDDLVCVTNAANSTFECLVPGSFYLLSSVAVLNFTETGLPSGTPWSVGIAAQYVVEPTLWSSSQASIVARVQGFSSESYRIEPVSGYAVTPSSGTANPIGGSANVSVAFVPDPGNYTITFTEQGLGFTPWATLLWGVDVSGIGYTSSSWPVVVSATNGTYSYTPHPASEFSLPTWIVSTAPGYVTPASGVVNVSGHDVTVLLRYVGVASGVAFVEAGLPAGSTWSATLGSLTGSTTSSFLNFSVAAGSYAYTIAPVGAFRPTPATGSVLVNGTGVVVAINFTGPATYLVAFNETGLATGTLWTVDLNGTVLEGVNATLDTREPNGSYAYNVPNVAAEGATPAAGTIGVSGADQWVAVRFSALPAPLEANFSYSVVLETCLPGGGVTNDVRLSASATGGVSPYAYAWTLPTGSAVGPDPNTTTTDGSNNTVSLLVSDAAGHTAAHTAVLPMLLPPCPPPAPGGGGPPTPFGVWPAVVVAIAIGGGALAVGLVLVRARERRPPPPTGEPGRPRLHT